jgi:hypothetical protein
MNKPTIILPGGQHVYILENSDWMAVYRDGCTVTVKTAPHAFWILLHYSLDQLSSMTAQACLKASVPAGGCPPLPLADIIRGGLLSNGGEWQMLALERAGEFDGKHLLQAEISQLVTSGKTQAIRHRALKLRARLKRQRP